MPAESPPHLPETFLVVLFIAGEATAKAGVLTSEARAFLVLTQGTMPRRCAAVAASTRELTSSFARMRDTCTLAVF